MPFVHYLQFGRGDIIVGELKDFNGIGLTVVGQDNKIGECFSEEQVRQQGISAEFFLLFKSADSLDVVMQALRNVRRRLVRAEKKRRIE